jgi:hypothetical protein
MSLSCKLVECIRKVFSIKCEAAMVKSILSVQWFASVDLGLLGVFVCLLVLFVIF